MAENEIRNIISAPFSLKLYTGLTSALIPILHISKPLLAMYGGFKDTVPERLGKFSPVLDDLESKRGDKPLLWIHAVSVGETSVAKVLIEAIRKQRPDCLIAVSVTTFTGRDYILKNFKPDALFFFPLDLYPVMKRLVKKLEPDCFLDIEIELWPNLFRALTEAGVPMALANGRISDRAAKPPSIAKCLYKWMYGAMDALFMRSPEDVMRAIALGAPKEKTHLAGNLKFASCGVPPSDEERNRIRKLLGIEDKGSLLVAGSTHPGEDEQIIDAWRTMVHEMVPSDLAPLQLVIAPRHLEQVDRIVGLINDAGFTPELWTDIRDNGRKKDGVGIFVINTIGELMNLYGAADIAFVGGSLIQRGGHNVLEPVAMGVPTMHGPSMANFHDIKNILGNAGLLYEIMDKDEFAATAVKILKEVDRADYLRRARDLISKQMQAQDMIADWVVGQL